MEEIWKDAIGFEGLISECCRGKRKTAGGFRWEQEDQK